jgi:hypothetical protein
VSIISSFYYASNIVTLTQDMKNGNLLADRSLGLDIRIILKRILGCRWLDSTCSVTCEYGPWNSYFRNCNVFWSTEFLSLDLQGSGNCHATCRIRRFHLQVDLPMLYSCVSRAGCWLDSAAAIGKSFTFIRYSNECNLVTSTVFNCVTRTTRPWHRQVHLANLLRLYLKHVVSVAVKVWQWRYSCIRSSYFLEVT